MPLIPLYKYKKNDIIYEETSKGIQYIENRRNDFKKNLNCHL